MTAQCVMSRQHGLEDPVCIVDLGAVARLFRDWMAAMPRVVPFYAVKANNDEAIIALLATLGAGFDCASDAEVHLSSSNVLSLCSLLRRAVSVIQVVLLFWLPLLSYVCSGDSTTLFCVPRVKMADLENPHV